MNSEKVKNIVREMGPLIGLIVLFIVIAALNDSFIDPSNLKNLARQISINALIAFGMTFVILTGGIAYNPNTEKYLKEYIGFIAPITVYPGEDELLALCQGALRVMTGEEKPMEY